MKFSNDTLLILKNFASINTNILIKKGNVISTLSNSRAVFAKAIVEEDFPVDFGIYDLNTLLGLISFAENQDIEFGERSLTISKDGGTFEYFYASPSILVTPPSNNISLVEHYSFDISSASIHNLVKAAAITSAKSLSLTAKDGEVFLWVGDKKNQFANSYRKKIGESDLIFDCSISVENFKLIPSDYKAILSKNKFLNFKSESKSLEYFIACEPSSTI